MKRSLVIPALLAAAAIGGAVSPPAAFPNSRGQGTEASAASSETLEYQRRLADYQKDQAAYEADPGTWTAEIPRKPLKPYAVLLLEYEKNRAAYEADPGIWTAEIPQSPERLSAVSAVAPQNGIRQ